MSLNLFCYGAGDACDAIVRMNATCYHLLLSKKDYPCPMSLYAIMLMIGLMLCHWEKSTAAGKEVRVGAVPQRGEGECCCAR